MNQSNQAVTRLIVLPSLLGYRKTGISTISFVSFIRRSNKYITDQASVILPVFERFSINKSNIGFFVLDNATNNDTILVELRKAIGFEPKERRLRYIGHIINLIAKAYLYGQDVSLFQEDYKKAGRPGRRQL